MSDTDREDIYVGGIGGSMSGADQFHIFEGNLSLCGEIHRLLGQRDGASFATHWDFEVDDREDAEQNLRAGLDLCKACSAAGGWKSVATADEQVNNS